MTKYLLALTIIKKPPRVKEVVLVIYGFSAILKPV
jgi:hypothetical protein